MIARTCKRFYKGYKLSFALGPPGFTLSKSTSLLKNFDELYKPLVLSNNLILVLETLPIALSITK